MIVRAAFTTLPAAALAALALAACSESPDPDSLYPLNPGLEWTYRVQTKRQGRDSARETRVMTNVERIDFGKYEDLTVRRNNYGTRYFETRLEDGIYRIATKSVIRHHPIMAQPPVRILPLPAKQGSRWREPAHAYMLDRASPFITADQGKNGLVLDYRVEDTDADVRVPAGRFTGCTLAVGRTTFHLGSDLGLAPTDVPIVQKEWYCPGVGLVRMSRDERVTSQKQNITGGHMEIRLLEGPGQPG